MSVLKGYLRLSLAQITANFRGSRFIAFALLFIGLFASGLFLAQSHSAGIAARRSSNDAGIKSENKSGSVFTSSSKANGRANGASSSSNKLRRDDPSDPAQGCTVNCTATVPATGAVNESINFAATATTNGCATQPTFEWNFGDGSARSTQQNPAHGYLAAGAYTWTLTTTASTGSTMIDTIAGGLGEGNLATQSPFGTVIAVARDPQNRGIYVADMIGGTTLIRFINTSNATVTIAGRSIAPGVVRAVAGGGAELGENISGVRTDLGSVAGLDTSADGNLLYYVAQADRQVRALNVSSSNVTVAATSIATGNIGTLASDFGQLVNGLAVNNATGDVIVADATPGVNKIFKVTSGGVVSTIAGNGATTQPEDVFSAGPALTTPLLQPRSVEVDGQGRVIIADTGHARVIRVEANGNTSLLQQFVFTSPAPNPFPSGLAVRGTDVYVALANLQTIVRLNGNGSATTVAGVSTQSCDYSVSNCGDGGPGISATLGLQGSTGNIPLAGITADANGVFIGDQSLTGRGRIRYLNQSAAAVTLAGVTIAPNAVDRIGGNGLTPPYDGGLATSATFNSPTGVATDANNNLWVADTISSRLRFVNRGTSPVKIFAGTASEQTVAPGVIVTVNKNVGAGANDGVPVIQAGFDSPQGLFITSQGIYLVDSKGGPTVPQTATGRRTSTLRFINTSSSAVTFYPGSGSITVPPGQIAKIAGGGESQAANGDGGFALAAKFIGASDVVVDGSNNIYLTDTGGNAVRRINGSNGQVSSILSGKQYTGLGIGPDGRIYVTNYTDGTVLRETAAASANFAVLASGFNKPRDVAVAADGNAYVTVGPGPPPAAAGNSQIVQINPSGTVTVVAGSTPGFGGDGGPAAIAQVNLSPPALVVSSGTANQLPETVNIIVSPTGEIIFTDTNNNRVRRLSSSTSTCTKTGTITIQGNNPQPQLTSLNPTSALVGSGSFTLTVNGSGFVPTSVINWGGQNRPTTFVSNSQLTAAIPASDLDGPGTINITVFNGAPGGGTSNALPFTVSPPNPVPTITSLNPNTAVEGSSGFTLTVTGTNFVNGAVVRWDGSPRTTTFISATQLTAQILTSDLVGTGQASVTVFNPAPGGGASNVAIFNITAGQNPAPTLTSISPNSATAGGPAFDLTATGTNFVASSKVRWNGTDLATAFVSATQLLAQVPASLIAGAGSAQVTVFTPTPGGGVTSAQVFTINNPAPAITSLNPSSATAGGAGFTLTVNGSGFINGSTVQWNGSARTTAFGSSTQLMATITAGDLTTAGTATVTVVSPAPGGGTSNSLTFTINNPTPAITSLSPSVATPGGAGFTLTVNGTGFVNGSVVRWDGQIRPTTFVSATQLTAQIPAGDLVGIGQASVTVFNPAPGGGASNVAIFNITAGQNPAPTLTSISPNSATAGGPAFDLTATGTNFVASSKVRWNGTDLATAFVSATQLLAQVPANLIIGAASAQVTVFTPTPGGGVTTAQTFTINPGQTPAVTSVSAASFLGTAIAPESIVAAFGVNLATGVAIATTVPLPTTLLGTKVTVRDSAGTSRDAALFFVAPSQINYQVPPGTAEGAATVTVTINNNVVGAGAMNVAKVAPGLFSANATGTGIVAAVVLRIRNGVQTFEAVTSAPIDLGPDTDTVYLLAYGTGMRSRTNAANISVNLGGTVKTLNPNLFEDAVTVPGFVGLDQVNIVLPRTLIGRGLINLVVTVDGKPSNTVQIAIK